MTGEPPIEMSAEQLQAAEHFWKLCTTPYSHSVEAVREVVEKLGNLGIAVDHGAQIGALDSKNLALFHSLGWEGMQYLVYRYFHEGWHSHRNNHSEEE